MLSILQLAGYETKHDEQTRHTPRVGGYSDSDNSAYRSSAHDKSKGRSGTGAHTLGQAVDIRCNTSETRFKVVQAAIAAGFSRIGIDKAFVHVDDSSQHAQCVMWLY